MSRYFLGVDGGRTSTLALVGGEHGQVVGRGSSGGCQRSDSLRWCIGKACRAAGIDADSICFEAACLGFAGGGGSQRKDVEEVVRARKLVVTDDAEIAWQGAAGGEPGIVTIAGTGSIAVGRNRAGKRARAGGWGFVFGDEGGAFDIVRQAVRAALGFEEGWAPKTLLYDALLEATGSQSANAMLHRFYGGGDVRKLVARHAPLVDRVAAEGDAVARNLLDNGAQQLAALTAAVRRRLFQPNEKVRVAYVGGVFQSSMILERFRTLVESDDRCVVRPPQMAPVEGALAAAYRAKGLLFLPS